MMVLEYVKQELKENLDLMIDKSGKRRGEGTNVKAELESNLNTAETRLAFAQERNNQMERDLVRLKAEIQVSLK